jgi:hypothetical protein
MAKLRIKSDWFQTGTAKTPAQMASAMAFIAWRVAQNTLKQMRSAHFDIEVGPQYFAFTREVLVFLTQVLDRMAYERMEPEGRAEFITALVRRVAEVLQENEDSLLGVPPEGAPSHYDEVHRSFQRAGRALRRFRIRAGWARFCLHALPGAPH